MGTTNRSRSARTSLLWPLILVVTGGVLLLNNFLLIQDFQIIHLLPLILVVAGIQILLQGDMLSGGEGRAFGITRGNIESATLEINAGDIDINLRALRGRNQERLIAGQYAPYARPDLRVNGTHAHLQFARSHIPLLALNDWEIALAQDLPWQFFISTHVGQVIADLKAVITDEVTIATGVGDIWLTPPFEAFKPLFVRSTLGSIHIETPPGYNTQIHVEPSRFFGIRVDENRYEQTEEGIYQSLEPDPEAPLVTLVIRGGFGDAYFA